MIRSGLMAAMVLMLCGATANAQDVAAGEKSFAVCRACHQIGPGAKIGVGPVLNGIVGRKAGTYPGYKYLRSQREVRYCLDP